jgi:hypothetical protein
MKAALVALLLLLLTAPAPAQVQPLTAWWIDTGDTDSTMLGPFVESIGDINQDGLSDFALMVGGNELHLYLGDTQPDTLSDIVIHTPDSTFGWFGYGLFNVGDVNGDGYSDFIAGGMVTEYSDQRYAYLYFGEAVFDTMSDVRFTGDSTSGTTGNFALRGAGLGDVNGDSFNDFAILDEGYLISNNPYIRGAIYLYYGGNPPDSIPDIFIYADSTLNRIGRYIAPLGDVNGDSYDDWVMSHPQCYGPQEEHYAGVVAIYYGGNPPDTIPHTIIYGSAADAMMGKALTTLDWNGDGQDDIFVGSAYDFPPNFYSSVWEFNVSPNMTGQPDHIFLGQGGTFNCIGNFMFHADLNSDGRQDLIDGEPGWQLAGKVYVFLNGTGQDTLFDATYYQGNFDGYLGHRGCNIGDTNNDGIEDMVIGEGNGPGRIHVILGDDGLHQSGVSPFPESPLPQTAVLLKAYPNPFNSEVVLEITAPSLKDNIILIYNLGGQEVRQFHLGYGQKRAVWNGKNASGQDCAAGVYWAKLTGPNYQVTEKLTLIR